MREYYDRQAKERQQVRKGNQAGSSPVILPELTKGDSRDLAGKAVGVSGKLIDFATKVIDEGTPDLVKAVEQGRVSVSAAAKVAGESEEFQKSFLDDPKPSRIRELQAPKEATLGSEGRSVIKSVAASAGSLAADINHLAHMLG